MLLNFGLRKLNLAYNRAYISFKGILVQNSRLKINPTDLTSSISYYNLSKAISFSNQEISQFKVSIIQLRNMTTSQANFKITKSFENILQSHQDKRQYRGLILNNGIKCLLISDPLTDRSAAAVDVHAGYMLDPKEFPGLAHFCEHMLFMGSKKVH
jgi:hypothetical protein